MFIYDIIDKKRKGQPLTNEEIDWVVENFVNGKISDAQMSALLMAITINGMTDDETFELTIAMKNSGKTYSYPFLTADKHSTGGVSDSTTLVILPLLACMGVKVAKMSGKSLGFTGGTIDKISVFDGYNCEQTEKDFIKSIDKIGASLISQSDDIAKADKLMYALRDKTATVNSIPLIASSIMSKKLACGADIILLDVKYGRGALLTNLQDSIALAKLMVKMGKMAGKKVVAYITNMDTPLSTGVGCNVEVYEVLRTLNGCPSPLATLSKTFASQIYSMYTGKSVLDGNKLINQAIETGAAYNKFRQIVLDHGGKTDYFDNINNLLGNNRVVDVIAKQSGYVTDVDALEVAKVVKHIKDTAETPKDYERAGVTFLAVGTQVHEGDVVAKIYTHTTPKEEQYNTILNAIVISTEEHAKVNLVEEVIK